MRSCSRSQSEAARWLRLNNAAPVPGQRGSVSTCTAAAPGLTPPTGSGAPGRPEALTGSVRRYPGARGQRKPVPGCSKQQILPQATRNIV
ncbi:hypothetical protein NDU88_000137 [Pleurodeles waltl]|uniref:Uncharacterized protein n=1 Tax=Pleurodeles waltl TaxID=8319 RepID=A0AAV7R3Z7_PLEWA|nr:hypothetical protein NDU88_000137 [Pleurodeles waltl]